MSELRLPQDLIDFLQSGKQAEYDPATCEAGKILFLPLDQLKLEYFPMTSESPDDPHQDESGCYLVRAVSLIASCDDYDPIGLLLWLPLDKRYGLWDGEHGTLFVFDPQVSWTQIASDLPHYINAEWGDEDAAAVTSLVPWTHHPYNAEQICHPLPELQEWYQVNWVRRGVYRDGVQLQYPEELKIRIECDRDRCEIHWQRKPAEKDAVWSPPETVSLSADQFLQFGPKIDLGFWNQPREAPGGPGGEPSTIWRMSGFRDVKYRSLSRFYEPGRNNGDPIHELGKQFAELASMDHVNVDN